MNSEQIAPSHGAAERTDLDTAREELSIHYSQLKALDDHLFQYSSVFFTISAALLAFLAQLHPLDPLVYLFIAFLGYTSAVCIFLIAWKGYFSWEIQNERVRILENRLGYRVSEWPPHSHTYEHHWPARNLSIAKIRWIFNMLLGFMWAVLILDFPRLTDTGSSPLIICAYPVLIPVLVAIPLFIAYGPTLINELTKGRSSNE